MTKLQPELRFKEFSGDWEENKLGELLIEYRLGGNYKNSEVPTDYPLIKMGNLDRGKIKLNKIEYIVEGENIENIDLIKKDDIFFNTRNTLDLVGKVAIWRSELSKAFYNSNLMLMRYSNNRFMNYRLNSFEGIKKLRSIATGTTSVAAIYTKDLLKVELSTPCLEEQEKIALFLSLVDEKIQKLEGRKKKLEEYKKGIMQGIFSAGKNSINNYELITNNYRFKPTSPEDVEKYGESYPDWEEKKLGEISKFSKGKNISKADVSEIGLECIRYGELYTRYSETISDVVSKTELTKEQLVLSGIGDILIPASGETAIDLATASCIMKEGIAIGGDINIIKTNENGVFMAYYMNSAKKHAIASLAQGISVIHIYNSQLQSLKLNLPCLEEQQKISDFLSSVDEKIEKVGAEVERMKEFKKGLLQGMFV
ncbi:MAG: restriction endonuclease subunit S [Psychrilyobacter sp.]|uniref:restriction endonuclease subunit S n=1 Tax=Psychrilyobacter sp. TaxID=2586924 RepID=UPI003C74CB60